MSSTASIVRSPPPPPFTRRGLRAGAAAIWPLLPGLALYGMAFGVMAAATGLSLPEAAVMSGWVHAGGAQMAGLQVWADPLPLLALCLTTIAMNARYLLLGATLRPWLGSLPAHKAYPSLFVLGDGNWAMALREEAKGRRDAAFLLGSGLVMWATWVSSTAAGHTLGRAFARPEAWGLDFVVAAYFATMIVDFQRSAAGVAPLVVGVAVAVVAERLLPGGWYVLAGALAGSAVGVVRA